VNGLSDMALAGTIPITEDSAFKSCSGYMRTLDESPFVVFSAINALSPTGSYPFDSRANGFVIGLGGGVLPEGQ